MKIILTTLLLSTGLLAFSQKEEKKPWFTGVIEYENDIHIAHTEVSYADWFAFIYDQYADANQDDFKHLVPTTQKSESKALWKYFNRNWNENGKVKLKVNTTIVTFHLWLTKEEKSESSKIKRYLRLPITGLSREQVQAYLTWMKEIQTEIYLAGYEGYEIEVELPGEDLYKKLISETKREGAVGDSVNVKGCPLFNFYMINDCPSTEERIKIYNSRNGVVAADDYYPDNNGYYNILGNVSEMSSTNGVAYGGNYTQFANDILSNPKTTYSEGDTLVGFRYIIQLKKK